MTRVSEPEALPQGRRGRSIAAALLTVLALSGAVVVAGFVDTPFWAPINRAGCYWHGGVPTAKLSVNERFFHTVPLPASHGGKSRIESVEILGTASQADVSFAVVPGHGYGAYKGDIPPSWRENVTALREARLKPAADFNTGDPARDEAFETTASGVALSVEFSSSKPGHYEINAFRMVFRQGWRKATCTRSWGAKFDVA